MAVNASARPSDALHEMKLAVMPLLQGDSIAAMLYGSRARGSSRPDSDVDIIQVVSTEPRAYSVGNVNVAQYRAATLRMMSRAGSLFIYHLKIEGLLLYDPHDVLKLCLDSYMPPDDYSRMLGDIGLAAIALDPRLQPENVVGVCRLGIYLLRTTLYIHAMQRGLLTFDLDLLLQHANDHRLDVAMAFRHLPAGDLRIEHVTYLHARLEEQLGIDLRSNLPNLEAVAVDTADNPRVRPLFENLLAGEHAVNYSALAFPPF